MTSAPARLKRRLRSGSERLYRRLGATGVLNTGVVLVGVLVLITATIAGAALMHYFGISSQRAAPFLAGAIPAILLAARAGTRLPRPRQDLRTLAGWSGDRKTTAWAPRTQLVGTVPIPVSS